MDSPAELSDGGTGGSKYWFSTFSKIPLDLKNEGISDFETFLSQHDHEKERGVSGFMYLSQS